ncbi:MAG: zinc ribbon domain-containing protein [Actinomycetota bacterium]|nr:zinc ribbon domain-containing protein [Actinomycetota bacterium]
MKRLMTAVLTLTLLTFIAPLPAPAAPGAGNAKIDSMSIRVQPEYDDPRVLAVLESVLSNDTKLPLKVEFFISKKTTNIEVGMACEVPKGEGHRCKVYDTADAGDDWQSLTYSVDTARNLFLEYYWDPFKDVKAGKKSFVYEFKSPYPIKKLDVQVQQGKKATDFKVDPVSTNLSQDQEGFKWYTYTFTDVKPDQVLTFNVSYTKTDPQPEVKKEVAPPATGNGTAQPGNPTNIRIFIFLFVLLFVAGVLAAYWRSKVAVEAAPAVKPSGRPKPKGAKLTKTQGKTAKAKFCGQCGSDIEPGNKFCSACGSEVV